jgi:4-amino-4-deoxy-L-arabinose transferase-like glycosyltransferase
MRLPNKYETALIILTIFGAIIRFWSIGLQYTNFDEQFTQWWAHPTLSPWQIFWVSLTDDYTPPLHYLAVYLSQSLFGVTAESLRYPSAIAGILTIPVSYYIGKLYKDELFGVMCAAFICTLYPMVYYSNFGRAYAFGILFIGIAFYYFLRILDGDNSAAVWFGLTAPLALWSHLYTAIPIGLMGFYILYEIIKKNRYLWAAILLPVILCAPLTNLMMAGLFGRGSAISAYGAKPFDLFVIGPLDMYGYAALVFIPIIVYEVWKHKDDIRITLPFVITFVTVAITFSLLKVMAIVPHYLVYIPMLLIIPVVIPFYGAVKDINMEKYSVYVTMSIITIINFYQIGLLLTMQRLPAPM